jgi:ATP-dependent DNA helicase PIF1
MLHHPFTDWEDLLSVEDQVHSLYIEAFRACQLSHSHLNDFYTDSQPEDAIPGDNESSDSCNDDEEADNYPLADFEALARRHPRSDFPQADYSGTLGDREIDRNYDWASYVGQYDDITPELWDQLKAENPIEQLVDSSASTDKLNPGQLALYNVVVNHYISELSLILPKPRQLLLNIDGVAGSGKTFTLLKVCARLQDLAIAAGKPNPVFRAAPTGVAAFNFTGKTLHSLLRLPVKRKTVELLVSTLQYLQACFQGCRYLIIDEKSMVDLKTLSIIDDRLRVIFPTNSHLPFGGVNLLLCGDFF